MNYLLKQAKPKTGNSWQCKPKPCEPLPGSLAASKRSKEQVSLCGVHFQTDDGTVTVKAIAGEALGAKAVIETQTPIMYLHFTLQPGAIAVQPVPREYNAFTYVLDGEGLFGADSECAGDGQMVLFAQDGEVER